MKLEIQTWLGTWYIRFWVLGSWVYDQSQFSLELFINYMIFLDLQQATQNCDCYDHFLHVSRWFYYMSGHTNPKWNSGSVRIYKKKTVKTVKNNSQLEYERILSTDVVGK